jgi:hypothetical protein
MGHFEFRLFLQHPTDALLTAVANRYADGKFKDRSDLYVKTGDGAVGVKVRDVGSNYHKAFSKLEGEHVEVKVCRNTASIGGFEAEHLDKHVEKLSFSRIPAVAAARMVAEESHAQHARWQAALGLQTAVLTLKLRSKLEEDGVDTEVTFINAKILRHGMPARWSGGWVTVCLESDSLDKLTAAVQEFQRLLFSPGCAPRSPLDIFVGSYARWIERLCDFAPSAPSGRPATEAAVAGGGADGSPLAHVDAAHMLPSKPTFAAAGAGDAVTPVKLVASTAASAPHAYGAVEASDTAVAAGAKLVSSPALPSGTASPDAGAGPSFPGPSHSGAAALAPAAGSALDGETT